MGDKQKIQDADGIQRENASGLSEAEIRYRAVFEQSTDGILIIDAEGKIVDFNKAAHTDLGYTSEEFSKFSISDIDPVESPEEIRAHIQRTIAEKKAEFEVTHRTKSGELRNVLVITQTIVLLGHTVLHVIWRDITEQKAAEKALLESEAKYRDLFENASDAVFVLDSELRYVDVNRRGLELLGYTREELLGRQPFDFIPEQQRPHSAAEFEKLRRTGSYETFEGMMMTKDGRWIDIEVSSSAIFRDGVFAGSRDIVRDITGRKQMEKALQQREESLARAQIIAHVGDWEWDIATNAVHWSDELYRIYGFEPHAIAPDYGLVLAQMHHDSKDEFMQAIDAALKQDRHFEMDYRFIRKDGTEAILHTIGQVVREVSGDPVRMFGIVQDITERKRAEERLQESEDRFRSIFSQTRDGILIADTETKRFIEANRAICAMLGYTQDEVLGLGVHDIHPASDLAQVVSTFERQIHGDISFAEDIPMLRKDRSVFYADINAAIISLGGKQHLIGVFRDVTERKKAEDKLRRSEAFIRNILDTVDEGFIVIDHDFRILTANKAYCSQVGESCDSVIGRHCYEISHKTLRPCYEEGEQCAVRHVFETGEPHVALHKHPDAKGSILYVETKAFPIKDSTGAVTSVIETVNNITEKHLLEEEQLKTQKLEAIGILAGGIAHDFNNLLQGVFGYISMAKLTLDQKERSLAMLEQAEKALHMSVNLTTQLLTFSKGGKPLKKKIPLQSVIENSVRFALSGSSVDFRLKFDDCLWAVDADEGQIGQVIQNIVLNADQSMPAGGTIAITAKNICAPNGGLPAHLAEGKYVEISVKDNGIGIPEQYIPRLFDPYFTTKEKGSGLGLATSYSIIKNHGGLIDVKSQLGRGSTFFVYLPAVEAEEKRAGVIPAAAESARKGRILVMDDEEVVRTIVGIMLRALGHEHEFAENGEEAIAKYREALSTGRRFDIVILDLTIRGGMGGEEALQELLALDPEVKAVVSSGYSDSATISEYESRGFSACLTKPYEVDALRDILNMLLK